MIWTIFVILLILWLLGLVTDVAGAFIHVLLIFVVISLVFALIGGRRAV